MEYTQKVVIQSNYWYNDGLKKAKIRDLTGAVSSLKKSLQFNSENIAARNLLGLVYYGRGEVGEALVEWILSKNLRSHDNIANYYIKKIQQNQVDLLTINQAVRGYNQSLAYCQQNGEDMAIIQLKKVVDMFPGFLRAHQLMALIYLHTEQYSKARHVLKAAIKIDTTNEITLRYMHELKENRHIRSDRTKKDEEKTVTYTIGNETIIQPVSAVMKDNTSRATFINVVTGIVIGVAVMWFLVLPMSNKRTVEETNKQIIEFSNKIAEEEAQIAALKTELESFRAVSEETESAQQTAASTQDSYETIMEVYSYFLNDEMSDSSMVDRLLTVNPDSLGSIARSRYDEMTSTIYARYGEALYYRALENYDVANYSEAVDNLTKLMSFDESYANGEAMFLLSKACEAAGDAEGAKNWKEKVEKDYPNVDTSEKTDDDEYYEE